MAFTDDFSGLTDGDALDASANWTSVISGPLNRVVKQSSGGTDYITYDQDMGGANGRNNYLCPDQGSGDQYVQSRLFGFDAGGPIYTILRAVDELNKVGWYLGGNGGSGLRLDKHIAGTITRLSSHQGVSDGWYKLEADGDQYTFYSGGSGATPGIWSVLSGPHTISNTDLSVSETSMGVGMSGGSPTVFDWISDFEAGPLGGGGSVTSSGAAVAGNSAVAGIAQAIRQASGAVVLGDSVVAGAAKRIATATGGVVLGDSVADGSAGQAGQVFSSGAAQIGDSVVAGAGKRRATTQGDAQASDSVVAGVGKVTHVVISSDIQAGDSRVSGLVSINGEPVGGGGGAMSMGITTGDQHR